MIVIVNSGTSLVSLTPSVEFMLSMAANSVVLYLCPAGFFVAFVVLLFSSIIRRRRTTRITRQRIVSGAGSNRELADLVPQFRQYFLSAPLSLRHGP